MWDSFHGASLDAISIGGEAVFRKNIGPLMPGTEHVKYYYINIKFKNINKFDFNIGPST